MEQEIFDDYIWNEHKKILTADKHKIPGLRNLSHFTPMAPGVPVPLHYHSDIIELHFMVKGQRKTYVMKGGVRTSYCATGNNLLSPDLMSFILQDILPRTAANFCNAAGSEGAR